MADIVPCGSRSMSKTRLLQSFAQYAPRFAARVVLPTPPLLLARTRTRVMKFVK
jgi:hypothetical protein